MTRSIPFRRARIALAALVLVIGAEATAAPRVVVDIAPLHSIAQRVMGQAGTPELLLPPGTSPHDYALRPSQADALTAADIVLWSGAALVPWLERPLGSLAPGAIVLAADTLWDVHLLPVRTGAAFLQEDGEAHEQAHDAHHRHDHSGHDPHLWLDPANAEAIANALASALAEADPAGAETYRANADRLADDLGALSTKIEQRLAPVKDAPFIVFHDAYQYFETRFGLTARASIVAQEGVPPGAARIEALRDLVREEGVACAFAEPQFEPNLLRTVIEGEDVHVARLDPLGAELPIGGDLYFWLLQEMTASLANCLGS